MRTVIFACGVLALAGCGTPYQPMGKYVVPGYRGGVQAVRITTDTAQIRAQGNAYTDPDTIVRYALRRAAEETIADGFDFFIVDQSVDRTKTDSTSFGGASGSRLGVFASAFTMPVIRPGQSLIIKMVHGPRPAPMPDNEYDAREVLSYLAPDEAK